MVAEVLSAKASLLVFHAIFTLSTKSDLVEREVFLRGHFYLMERKY